MKIDRLAVPVSLLVLVGVLFSLWAFHEAGRQKAGVVQALSAQASLLARSLGPGLAAASGALRELDEIVIWKLLDNARLLAEIASAAEAGPGRIARLAEENGLDSVVFFGAGGDAILSIGEPVGGDLPDDLAEVIAGNVDEIALGSVVEEGIEHIGAAAGIAGGGAVLVRIEASAARTFARRLGVANLLEKLVGSGGVLYLSYREEPAGRVVETAWDSGPVPPPGSVRTPETVRGRPVFEVTVPVETPAGGGASLRVGLDGTPLQQAATSAMRRTALVGAILAGFVIAAGAFVLVRRQRLIERADSARRLAEADAARRRNERLAAAGALTAGLAHEVRSPLNAIGLAAQRLERKHDEGDERREIASRIAAEVRRLESVLREFLDFARPVGASREPVDLTRIAGEVLSLLEAEAEAAQASVHLVPSTGSVTIRADRESIRRALINLVRNAVQASPSGGRVEIAIERNEERARILVTDEGPGIPDEMRDKVLEPFVGTRPDGSGLGLALARRVAQEHGGSLDLRNRPEGGARATFILPLGEE